MKTVRRVVVGILVAAGLLMAGWWGYQRYEPAINRRVLGLESPVRKAWRDRAIAAIAARTADPGWLKSARDGLRVPVEPAGDPADAWLSGSIIVMTNGDWLAYTNICKKSDPRIHDLFIARGSDGQWYYSTFHFCIETVGLKIMQDTAPGSLGEFANAYRLYPFGKGTDECLRQTWPKRE